MDLQKEVRRARRRLRASRGVTLAELMVSILLAALVMLITGIGCSVSFRNAAADSRVD